MRHSDEPTPNDPRPLRLPTPSLQQAWETELERIGEYLAVPIIRHHIAHALGFTLALQAAGLIGTESYRAMIAAVHRAEQAAYQRLGRRP
jgi:hypothetical protein